MTAYRLLVLTSGLAATMAAAPIAISNTGTTAPGTVDPNWTITSPAGSAGSAFVTVEDGFPIGPWVANSALSRWIQPDSATAENQAATTFVYRTSFSLAGLVVSSAELNFRASADNQITAVRLNGNSVGFSFLNLAAFSGTFQVTTDAWFNAGNNVLEFDVLNFDIGPNPSGLRVEITGTADAIPGVVPEPATFLLAAPVLAAMYLRGRRAA